MNIVQTLYSLPTVLVGLLLFLLISSSGPFGQLISSSRPDRHDHRSDPPDPSDPDRADHCGPLRDRSDHPRHARLARGDTVQQLFALLREARFAILAAVALAFGRAISEVGVAIMIGGNIRGYTRMLTTAISLETGRGNISLSIALGIILLSIALVVNIGVNLLQGGGRA